MMPHCQHKTRRPHKLEFFGSNDLNNRINRSNLKPNALSNTFRFTFMLAKLLHRDVHILKIERRDLAKQFIKLLYTYTVWYMLGITNL